MSISLVNKAYKYTHEYFAKTMLERGEIRIGTLLDFTNEEKHDNEIGDGSEGKKILFKHYENLTINKKSDVPDFLVENKLVGIPKKENVHHKYTNCTFATSRDFPDSFTYCLSYSYDSYIMDKMRYNTVLIIDDLNLFINEIEKRLISIGKIKRRIGLSICQYRGRQFTPEMDNHRLHPAFLKEPRHAYQKEIRAVWEPIEKDLHPFNIEVPEIKKYIRLVTDGF